MSENAASIVSSAPLEGLGVLNVLRHSRFFGRDPTEEEWRAVEHHSSTIFRLMTDAARRRFNVSQIPPYVAYLPVVFLAFAVGALWYATDRQSTDSTDSLLPYIVWLASLGAMGAIAFIGMNALSIQEDLTFGLSDRLITLRIVLGALFGVVLTIPFGYQHFQNFVIRLVSDGSKEDMFKQAIFLLQPFVLGFSTSLVIMVMNRLSDAVQAFFGAAGNHKAGTSSIKASRPAAAKAKGLEKIERPARPSKDIKSFGK